MSLEEEQVAPGAVPEVQQEQIAPAEPTAEQEAAPQDDAAFLEGFDSAQGTEATPVPEVAKLFGRYTEAEVLALLDKVSEVDKLKEREAKVFGTLGSYKQQLDQLRNQPRQEVQKFDAKLDRMTAEYPEMAEALREDLLGLQGSSFDSDAVERIVNERLEAAGKVNETKLLSVMHPDWRTIPSSNEFTQWKGTLSPEELQIVDDSWDALSVGNSLSTFKAWKSKATQAAQAKQVRQNRLEAAVTPKGGQKPPPAQTENDAFLAGWKSVRGV
jgi:uncharacterized protein (UPF0335 family)